MRTEKMLQKFRALVITGGSSGIGKSFVEHAYRYNPELVVFNVSRRNPEFSFTNSTQLKLHHFSCDLAVRDQVSRLGQELLRVLEREVPAGRILLVNNSGFGTYDHFPKPNLERNLEMLDLNVRAPLALTGLLLPTLKNRGGAVINVASTAAFQPTPNMACYGASKAFVLHWGLALSEELRGSGVEVLTLCPGPTSTQFFKNAGLDNPIIPDSLGQEPGEVVEAAFRGLARGKSLVVSGWKNRLGAALSSLLPKTFATRVAGLLIARFRPVKGQGSRHG